MTFAEIETVLGFKLPPKSQNYPAWWSNNPRNNVMTNEWLAAGFKTEHVDVEGRKLVFRRVDSQSENGSPKDVSANEPKRRRRHPLFGALKDITWVAPGVDLTEPADPEWADIVEHPDWGKLP